ncbi:diaminopropionate ammonia-lyase [Natribacillus halophilus]|uniref:Diaminopropionate ammonia-lyase n=1 Tax=Natribacillus halophilus TaxID=549003 RepID=A0A1G8QRD4_9BACI|nr:diaminopropionate ammonia-lyase [Natribacillus halophilus]SDJ07284.1 diaminopropionate ammonia-lyase [Natribacillus halophilus]
MAELSWTKNQHKQTGKHEHEKINREAMNHAVNFHKSLPDYAETPLYELHSLAENLGIAGISVKDEGVRFQQGSFKVLGSSYALAAYLSDYYELEFPPRLEKLQHLSPHIFATATDGNHGRGLAWSAKLLNQHANVYLPKGAARERLDIVQQLGATAEMTDINYDETVRYVQKKAEENDWIVAQDTAWEGYTVFPTWIMQGYLTIVSELLDQIHEMKNPTHLILQAGVGSFAGAIAGLCKQIFGDRIKILVVEPTRADGLYQSALAEDGQPRPTSGDLSTNMAGLSCGEPNPLAWDILKRSADGFVTCSDTVATEGARLLEQNDPPIDAGEAGAVPVGLWHEIMTNDDYTDLKEHLELNENAQVLLINTESSTCKENLAYRQAWRKP